MFYNFKSRKTKLIMAIVSLTMAFTFMALGVYAAAERTVGVSGSIGFNAERIDADITVKYVLATSTVLSKTDAHYTTNATGTGFANGKIEFRTTTTQGSTETTVPTFNLSETKPYAGIMIKITIPANTRGVKISGLSTTSPRATHFTLDQQTSGDALGTDGLLSAGKTHTAYINFKLNTSAGLADVATPDAFNLTVTLTRV